MDGYLDRADNAIRKHEDTAEAKAITYTKTDRLRKALEEIDREFRPKARKEPDRWTDKQRQCNV